MKKSSVNKMGLFGSKLMFGSSIVTITTSVILSYNAIDPITVFPLIMIFLLLIGAGLGILCYAASIKFKEEYKENISKLDGEQREI